MTKNQTAGRSGKVQSKKPTASAAKKNTTRATTRSAKILSPGAATVDAPEENRAIVMILVDEIRPDPTQPRKHFVLDDIVNTLEVQDGEAVNGHGISEPLTVLRAGGVTPFEILTGERRWRSAKAKGLRRVPCIVEDRHLTPEEVLERQIRENVARQNLTPLELSDALAQLVKNAQRAGGRRAPAFEDLAQRVGLTSGRVARRYLALARLAPEVRTALEEGKIGISLALELATLDEHADQVKALPEVVEKDLRAVRLVIANRYHLRIADGCGFDPTDATLPGGACEACPANTAAQRALWSDDSDDDARCTKRSCFVAKKGLTSSRLVDAAKARGARELTTEETKKLFPNAWSGVSTSAEVIDLNATAYVDAEKAREEKRAVRTWGEMLEGSVSPEMVATDPGGRVHLLASRDAVAAQLRERGLGEEADEVAGDDNEEANDDRRKTFAQKAAVMNTATDDALDGVVDAAPRLDPLVAWRCVASHFIEEDRGNYTEGTYGLIAARRGLAMVNGDDPHTPLVAWLVAEERTAREVVALVFEIIARRATRPEPGTKLRASPFVQLCELVGVDVLTVYREAYAEAGIDVGELDLSEEAAEPSDDEGDRDEA